MNKNLITHFDPKSPVSEAYRMLRTNLGYTGVDKKHELIVITSSKKSEGKTTTITNLAVTMAQSGHKVLIIDCDLRRPKIHKMFHLDNTVGLSDILLKDVSFDKALYHIEDVENLHIVTSGNIPPMPSELLDSQKMVDLLNGLRGKYDYVLLDAPPVLSVSDASILAQVVDGVILAVAANETHVDAISTAKRALDKVEANIIGTVLTKAKIGKRGYTYYYDYSYNSKKK